MTYVHYRGLDPLVDSLHDRLVDHCRNLKKKSWEYKVNDWDTAESNRNVVTTSKGSWEYILRVSINMLGQERRIHDTNEWQTSARLSESIVASSLPATDFGVVLGWMQLIHCFAYEVETVSIQGSWDETMVYLFCLFSSWAIVIGVRIVFWLEQNWVWGGWDKPKSVQRNKVSIQRWGVGC